MLDCIPDITFAPFTFWILISGINGCGSISPFVIKSRFARSVVLVGILKIFAALYCASGVNAASSIFAAFPCTISINDGDTGFVSCIAPKCILEAVIPPRYINDISDTVPPALCPVACGFCAAYIDSPVSEYPVIDLGKYELIENGLLDVTPPTTSKSYPGTFATAPVTISAIIASIPSCTVFLTTKFPAMDDIVLDRNANIAAASSATPKPIGIP